MTSPAQFDIEAEQILLEFAGGYFMSTTGERHLKRQAALTQLHDLCVRGKIDELSETRGWSDYDPDPKYCRERFHVVPYSHLTNRIATLEAELKRNGDKA